MPESVIAEIRHRYSVIGSSPPTELTLQQGRLLSEALGISGSRGDAQLEAVHRGRGAPDARG